MGNSRAVGNDPGTMFFQTAEIDPMLGDTNYKIIRNAFVELENIEDIEEILKRNGWQYVHDSGKYYVIGDDCIQVANMFPGKVEIRRPMADGVLNKNEEKKMIILAEMIRSSIGEATDNKSVVCTCVSSEAVDGSQDSAFHRARLAAMYKRLGWNVKIIEEGYAVILSQRPTVIEDGKEIPYSGIGISCLLPGTKIYTRRGIVNVEDVEIGDEVITHKGRWRKVFNVTKKQFSGECTKLQLTGYANNTELYRFVEDHELYIQKNGEWNWVGCNSVNIGDIVGEPIIKYDLNRTIPGITICEHTTCSNKYIKKRIECSSDVQRLIGYFLGDGHVCRANNNGIGFDFSEHEEKYADDVIEILKKNFNKNATKFIVEWDGSKKLRVCCYSKGLGNWFRNHCYDINKEKIFPWDISRLNRSERINLLAGLIRSDGHISNGQICFSNTSTNLIILAKQLFSSLGHAASISYRGPRISQNSSGKIWAGKKNEWLVSCGSKIANISLSQIIEDISCDNSRFVERIFISDNFCCSRVQKIEKEKYSGLVYDLQVDEDHSFSGPFLTIHNCGSGRTNCVLAYKGLQVLGMSASYGGDFIDHCVAEQTGAPIPQIINVKEKKLNFDNIDDSDDIQFALDTYYDQLIRKVFGHFAKRFVEVKSQFNSPLDIVVAGGTSMPKGFCKKLEKVVRGLSLPFEIKEVRHANDPRNAVVDGLLAQAIISQRKMEQGVADETLL